MVPVALASARTHNVPETTSQRRRHYRESLATARTAQFRFTVLFSLIPYRQSTKSNIRGLL